MAHWREPGSFDEAARAVGLRKDARHGEEHVRTARTAGVLDSGDYRVLGSYADGDVRVVIEQNEGPNPLAPPAYAEVAIVHDPVAVVSGPVGTTVVNLVDPDAEAALGRAKVAVTDPDYQRDVD